MSLIIIVLVLYLTYYFTKALSKKVANYSTSKYIRIIDKVAISQSKFLLIIEVEKKCLLLSVTDNNISILKELDDMILESKEDDGHKKDDSQSTYVKFNDILKENLLKNKITSKLKKGNVNYECDEFNKKLDN